MMGKTEDKTGAKGGEGKPKVKNTALDLQRMKLEKLMKNPEKPIVIPDRQKEKKNPHVPDFVRNVMGSSAGAGSGEFHVYRHLRRKEYARQKTIVEKSEKVALEEAFQQKLVENQKKAEDRTAKKRAKRLKRKQNMKKKKIEKAKSGVKMTDPTSDRTTSESESDVDDDNNGSKSESEGKPDVKSPSETPSDDPNSPRDDT